MGLDSEDDQIELVPPGEKSQLVVKTKATKAQMVAGFTAAASDIGVEVTGYKSSGSLRRAASRYVRLSGCRK